jgi:flagellar protein FlaF
MHHAAQTYGAVAKQIASPRELEANLLLKAASQLQSVRDAWSSENPGLDGALLYNRKLWTILLTTVTDKDNLLPAEIRQNVANLALFVLNQTIALLAEPRPEKLGVLININRELAAGLLGRA